MEIICGICGSTILCIDRDSARKTQLKHLIKDTIEERKDFIEERKDLLEKQRDLLEEQREYEKELRELKQTRK